MLTQEVLGSVPPEFVREFSAEILGSIPAEKVKADLNQAMIGRALIKEGAVAAPGGLGQKLGEVDARTFFRWSQEHENCWSDRSFIHEFFKDNPQLKSAGWTPTGASSTRHAVTFVNGTPISNLKPL